MHHSKRIKGPSQNVHLGGGSGGGGGIGGGLHIHKRVLHAEVAGRHKQPCLSSEAGQSPHTVPEANVTLLQLGTAVVEHASQQLNPRGLLKLLTWEADLGVGGILAEGCTSTSVICMLRARASISSLALAQRLARAYTLPEAHATLLQVGTAAVEHSSQTYQGATSKCSPGRRIWGWGGIWRRAAHHKRALHAEVVASASML